MSDSVSHKKDDDLLSLCGLRDNCRIDFAIASLALIAGLLFYKEIQYSYLFLLVMVLLFLHYLMTGIHNFIDEIRENQIDSNINAAVEILDCIDVELDGQGNCIAVYLSDDNDAVRHRVWVKSTS